MPSKIIVDKEKNSRALYNIGFSNIETLSGAIAARLLIPQDPIRVMILVSCQQLDAACKAMVQADEAYILEQGDDDAPRLKRDEVAKRLSGTLVDLRELARGVFGIEALKALGFSAITPQDPAQLAHFGREVATSITQRVKDGTLPTPRKGASLDLQAFVPELESDSALLGELLDKVSLEQRELQSALSQKNATLDAYVTIFQQTANLFEGLFRFVGQNDLADRVRPTRTQQGKLEQEPTEPTPA